MILYVVGDLVDDNGGDDDDTSGCQLVLVGVNPAHITRYTYHSIHS